MHNNNFMVLDIETNGIGAFRPIPTQTITQLAFIKFKSDGTVIEACSNIIKGATEIKSHPAVTISLERIKNEGVDYNVAINNLFNNIDLNTILVSHNFEFDSGLIKNAIKNDALEFPNNKYICTMKSSTDYCKLPKGMYSAKYSGYKFPTLKELSSKLDITIDSTKLHDAQYDCEITKKCLLEGLKQNIFKVELLIVELLTQF